jgi:hypothetical protein
MTQTNTQIVTGESDEVRYDPHAKPIWQEFHELSSSLPAEVVAVLPSDGADQHDHYIYGTPKRLL